MSFLFSKKRISFCHPRRASRIAGIIVWMIGCTAFTGWILGHELLKSVFIGPVTMKANTAFCFILAGGALWLLGREAGRQGTALWEIPLRVAQLGSILIALMGLLTLGQWFLGWELGLDHLFFYESPDRSGHGAPGRMAPLSALNFVLLGLALFTLSIRKRMLFAQCLAGLAGLNAVLGGLGHALLSTFYGGFSFYTPMSLSSSLSFMVLSAGILCVRTETGFPEIFSGPVRVFFRFVGGTTFALLLGLIITLGFLTASERKFEEHCRHRHESFILADELRQSSDDLTRFARSYIATGNSAFEQIYWQILAIRNGTQPRPEHYEQVYWDMIAAGENLALPTPGKTTRAVSLRQLMIEKGFSQPELDKLGEALERSNALVNTETAAFHAMKGFYDDGTGQFTQRGPPDQSYALQLLFSPAYFEAKAAIMKPINEFLRLLEARMVARARADEQRIQAFLILITGILSALFALTLFSGRLIFKRVCTPIEVLEHQTRMVYDDIGRLAQVTTEIARGNFSQSFSTETRPLHSLAHDEIGALSRTQDEMIRQLQTVGSAIAGITSDLSQRTATLNQANEELLQKIAERQKAEEALRVSEERFLIFMRNMPGVASIQDGEGCFLYISEQSESYFGKTPAQIVGTCIEDHVSPKLAQILRQADRRVLESGEPSQVIHAVEGRGKGLHILVHRFPIKDGKTKLLGSIIFDISQRVEAEKKVEAALKKEVVLKREIHHRVKNNLQVIISLLYLQSDQISDPKAREVLRECQSRTRSIALIYALLSGAEDLTRIRAVDYVRRLTADLLVSYRANPGQITLTIDAGELLLSVDAALPCGLIITELISNSLKYAFTEGRPGRIEVSLKQADSNLVRVRVRDNGRGLPAGFQVEKATSMGLTLVRDLTRQLNGTLHIQGESGTTVTVLFPQETSVRS